MRETTMSNFFRTKRSIIQKANLHQSKWQVIFRDVATRMVKLFPSHGLFAPVDLVVHAKRMISKMRKSVEL